ncbi:MAG: hypothetical protein IKJ88_02805 [Clostridia bacterium]|nr:hypothetical protein [Clostridia bacterium]
MNTYTVAFFGHREINNHFLVEQRIFEIACDLIRTKEYVEFLVGRNGEFDEIAASAVRRAKHTLFEENSALVWVMPYKSAEYSKNPHAFENYFDEIQICPESEAAYYKNAIQIRNRCMVDSADLIVCFIEKQQGGAYNTIKYAHKMNKNIIYIKQT